MVCEVFTNLRRGPDWTYPLTPWASCSSSEKITYHRCSHGHRIFKDITMFHRSMNTCKKSYIAVHHPELDFIYVLTTLRFFTKWLHVGYTCTKNLTRSWVFILWFWMALLSCQFWKYVGQIKVLIYLTPRCCSGPDSSFSFSNVADIMLWGQLIFPALKKQFKLQTI